MELLSSVLLVAFGFVAAEASAFFKWRRDRSDRIEEAKEEEVRRKEQDRQKRLAEEVEASVIFLAAAHHVALGSSLDGWKQAHITAMEALTKLRLLMPPDIAMAASRHFNAAATSTGAPHYKATLANLINKIRAHTGEDIIQEFEDYLNDPADGD